MSRPRSRSPLYSRIPTLHGRRTDGFFNEQIHSSVQSNTWRNPEMVNKVESNAQWNKGSYQGEQHVDHWAKFIDAIEHAQKRGPSPINRYRIQDDEERQPQSPRRLPRERLPSPDRIRLGVEERFRMPSPGWNRNEGVDKELGSQHNPRDLRDRSYPRHSEGRRQDKMDYGYHNEEQGDQYHERGPYSERSSKSDYREQHPSTKRFTDLGLQDEFVEHHRGFSPRRAPVIVEHDHGITKRDPRNPDPPKTSGHLQRNRDPPRQSETQRNREPYRDRTDQGHHTRTLQDRHGGRPNGNPREETRKNYSSYDRENPGRERSRHMEQSRMESYSRDSEGRREMVSRDMSDIDLRTRERETVHEWEEERPQRNHGRMMGQEESRLRAPYDRNPKTNFGPSPRMDFNEQETLKIKVDMSRTMRQEEVRPRPQYQRNPKTNAGPAPRMDFSEQETLKIKVDMSRPATQTRYSISVVSIWLWLKVHASFPVHCPHHEDLKNNSLQIVNDKKILVECGVASRKPTDEPIITYMATEDQTKTSYLGYSSDRQLSLDLVNVGRQRLDFLPMLEHSGTFRESAVHSGTFAQEIITLVHQVKENYFRGQGITLNARFANEQYYSLQDEFREEEEEEEMGIRPLMHGQHRMPSSETQDSRRQLMPDPGDLRYDLERRRQQRLEDVKITIAGGNFVQMTPESEPLYMRDDPEEVVENFRWSEQEREHPRQWDGPHQRMPEPTRQNFNPRGNSNRMGRQRGRRT